MPLPLHVPAGAHACDSESLRLRVQLPVVPLSGNNLRQVVHTCVPLSPSSRPIIWHKSQGIEAVQLGR